MSDRPRITVHSLDHAKAALEAAAALHRPVTIESASGAGCSMGPRWFLAVIEAARAAHPGADADCVLDCADEPGSVLAALRAGATRVRFTGGAEVREKLSAIAAARGAVIEHEDVTTLDLIDASDPLRAVLTYLA